MRSCATTKRVTTALSSLSSLSMLLTNAPVQRKMLFFIIQVSIQNILTKIGQVHRTTTCKFWAAYMYGTASVVWWDQCLAD